MLPEHLHADVRTLWDYHNLRHEPRRSDVGIGLGSRDPGVAVHTAELFHAGRFPLVVFTGPTRRRRWSASRVARLRGPEDVPAVVERAFGRLAAAGFTQRMLTDRGSDRRM